MNWSWILDLIILAIVCAYAYLSAKRGFVRTIIELAGFVAIFLVITRFGTPISEKIFDTAFRGTVQTKLQTALTDAGEQTAEAINEALPDFVVNGAEFLGIDITDSLITSDSTSALAEKLTVDMVRPVVSSIIYAVLSLLLFGLGMYLVRILARAINSLFKISLIGTLNRVLGAVLGVGKGLVVAFVVCLIITTVISFTKSGFWFFTKENIEASLIFSKIAELNPFYK